MMMKVRSKVMVTVRKKTSELRERFQAIFSDVRSTIITIQLYYVSFLLGYH